MIVYFNIYTTNQLMLDWFEWYKALLDLLLENRRKFLCSLLNTINNRVEDFFFCIINSYTDLCKSAFIGVNRFIQCITVLRDEKGGNFKIKWT